MTTNPIEYMRRNAFNNFHESVTDIVPRIDPDAIDPSMRPLLPALADMASRLFMAKVKGGVMSVPDDHISSSDIAVVPVVRSETLMPDMSLLRPTPEQLKHLAGRHGLGARRFQALTDKHIAAATVPPVKLGSMMAAATITERFYDTAKPRSPFKQAFLYGFSSRPYILIDVVEGDPVRLGKDGVHELVHAYDRFHQADDIPLSMEWQHQKAQRYAERPPEEQQMIMRKWLTSCLRIDKAQNEMRAYHMGGAVLEIPGIVTEDRDEATRKVEHIRRLYNDAADPFGTPPDLVDCLAECIQLPG
jgi:hypothetical protein